VSIEKKLTVLSEIAREFNLKQISWAVGASLLLYIKGIADNFNDIDIMVSEDDADKVKLILEAMGQLLPQKENAQFKTKVYLKYLVDGVEVDIFADFTIVSEGKEYRFPLKKGEISELVTINNELVALHSVQVWKHYYELMGRSDKVALIEKNA
jgi:hypothetical protein